MVEDLKESYPLQVAEYAVANKLVHEPAFNWWVPGTLAKRNRIIMARYLRRNQKFGIEVPHSVKRALEIDDETGTNIWRDAIRKEMLTIAPAVDIQPEGTKPPIAYQWFLVIWCLILRWTLLGKLVSLREVMSQRHRRQLLTPVLFLVKVFVLHFSLQL
jgi:hypothetical protein